MGHTNETVNYQLPQWVDSDHPSFTEDFNPAFNTIDNALGDHAEQLDGLDLSVRENELSIASVSKDISDMATRVKATENKDVTQDSEITSLKTTVQNLGSVPDYVITESNRVINEVNKIATDNSLILLTLADSHQMSGGTNITLGNTHAGQACKYITNAIQPDYCLFLGDATSWGGEQSADVARTEIQQWNNMIGDAFRGQRQLRTIGNHDGARSYQNSETYLKPSELYNYFGKFFPESERPLNITLKHFVNGYGVIDTDKYMLIMLNTADGSGTTDVVAGKEHISAEQMEWFAHTIGRCIEGQEGKQVFVFSHHPLDWGSVHYATIVINAFVNRTTLNFSYEGKTIEDDYTDTHNIFGANIHGHTHCYKVDNLHLIVDGSGVEIADTMRIATPNACFSRNNEYGQSGSPQYYGIQFGENVTYNKTYNTAQDTAFCIYVINLDEYKVHAIHYGAGIDREITYHQPTPQYTNVLDTVGYTDGKYVSEPLGAYGNDASYWSTGQIHWTDVANKPLYLKGCHFQMKTSHDRIYASESQGGAINSSFGYARGDQGQQKYNIEQLGDDYYKLTAKNWFNDRWFTMSMPGTGANAIITIGEPIE